MAVVSARVDQRRGAPLSKQLRPDRTLSEVVVEMFGVLRALPDRITRLHGGTINPDEWAHLDRQFAAIEAAAKHARRACGRALAEGMLLELPRTKSALAAYAELLGLTVEYPIDYPWLKSEVSAKLAYMMAERQDIPRPEAMH